MKMGKLVIIGVGPGDPELITLKAVKAIQAADVIACPAKGYEPGTAYHIAAEAVPEMREKEVLLLDFPMTNDNLEQAHREVADRLEDLLREGKNVGLLTLGDPAFYSTASYVMEPMIQEGYEIEVVNGIPSFCAASAKLLKPLALGNGAVVITSGEYRSFEGTLMIMKAGSRLEQLKDMVRKDGKEAYLVENCGMKDERIYREISEMPEKSGYFSIMIVQETKK